MKRYICCNVTSTCTKSGNTKAVCTHATILFITMDMYILFDDPSPLFHLLYMVLTSNFQFFEVKKKKVKVFLYVS